MSARKRARYSAARIRARVAELSKEISRESEGWRLGGIVTRCGGFLFGADLIRQMSAPTVCHFLRSAVRDGDHEGHADEVLFGAHPEWKGPDVLVEYSGDRGVTQDFLLRRLGEGRPCSFRPAVLLDKPGKRRLALELDYFEFRTASNEVWEGYGLAARNGTGRNHQQLSSGTNNSSRKSGKGREKKA